jgi:hypothetical protein
MIKSCAKCFKQFKTYRKRSQYCSRKCVPPGGRALGTRLPKRYTCFLCDKRLTKRTYCHKHKFSIREALAGTIYGDYNELSAYASLYGDGNGNRWVSR